MSNLNNTQMLIGESRLLKYYCYLDETTTLTIPASITLTLKNPNGVTSTPSLQNPSTGYYFYNFVPDVVGTWYARYSTSNPTDAQEWEFTITASRVLS